MSSLAALARSRQLAKLTSLVSGVVKIEQVDRMVYVTFGDGNVAICEPTQADIDAAIKMLDEQQGLTQALAEVSARWAESRKSSGGR